jgi:hypothetical protein
VDVITGGTALQSRDAQGRVGCSTPYKVVEFALPAGKALVLEFSASVTPSIRISVSRSPTQGP